MNGWDVLWTRVATSSEDTVGERDRVHPWMGTDDGIERGDVRMSCGTCRPAQHIIWSMSGVCSGAPSTSCRFVFDPCSISFGPIVSEFESVASDR